ncbi:Hypothetical predicted protein [Mytilus galloprovincialis]|uniref:Uncharacterized protein n=1 Tax=Mytilus galloprovincialis TaxID=29158 RepID=A0A8B6HNH6_MYTGA|nr:Hypothetical predicted protein [Mytilus galloprovincialis]
MRIGDSLRIIRETLKIASSYVADVTISGGRIYYTDFRSAKVYCFLLNGEEFWQFASEHVRRSRGVAVDNYNNVYVKSSESYNLSIIQHHGKDNQTLLRESDGLSGPSAVYYDKEKRTPHMQ